MAARRRAAQSLPSYCESIVCLKYYPGLTLIDYDARDFRSSGWARQHDRDPIHQPQRGA
ncbi:hypothetical protein EMIT0P4_230053 [Pseudomonas sp. IT-P4]